MKMMLQEDVKEGMTIRLMSDKNEAHLRTLNGKKELAEEIVEDINHIIHDDRKTGVKEILFTKFLIH